MTSQEQAATPESASQQFINHVTVHTDSPTQTTEEINLETMGDYLASEAYFAVEEGAIAVPSVAVGDSVSMIIYLSKEPEEGVDRQNQSASAPTQYTIEFHTVQGRCMDFTHVPSNQVPFTFRGPERNDDEDAPLD